MALSRTTFADAGGAASDIFAGIGYQAKAKGSRISAASYDQAAELSIQNARYTEISTRLKDMQQERQNYKAIGREEADIGGAGFTMGGSALDLLRESALQGGLARQTLQFQGAIQEESYREQARSYQRMAEASRYEADAQDTAAWGSWLGAGLKGAAAVATLFTGGAAAPLMAVSDVLPGGKPFGQGGIGSA